MVLTVTLLQCHSTPQLLRQAFQEPVIKTSMEKRNMDNNVGKHEATRDNQAETRNIRKPKTKHRNTQTEKHNEKENRGNKYNNNETTKGNITIKTPTHEKKTEGQTKHNETKHEAQKNTNREI